MSIDSAASLPVRATDTHTASHSGAGALNVNHGEGWQKNHSQSGGFDNKQFNADVIHYTQQQPAPDRRETPPVPDSTVPFPPDPHFIERKELAELKQTLSSARRRAALVGLGGVGKSQLAIEYCHRVREESPETWVLWLHASSAARYDASIGKLANDVKIFGRKDPHADTYQLTYDWLRDARNGSWVVVLDNADEAGFLLQAPGASVEGGNKGNRASARRARMEYLPICKHGSVLITSRYRAMAEKLVDNYDVIVVHAMTKEHAVTLLQKKIGQATSMADLERLAAALECMPLAITQALAYIRKRGPRCSVEQYLAQFEESEKSRTSLLAVDSGELRRDRDAANSILVTWQISFEHVSKTTPSAAELLSLMSFFDYQDIPEYVLQAAGGESLEDSWTGQGLEEDVLILHDYHFISMAPSGRSFAMHRLVQLAARKWLESQGQYQRWARQSMQRLDAVLPNGDYANWSRCRELSSHARLTMEVQIEERQARVWRASILYKAAWFAWTQGQAAEAQVLAEACVRERISVLGEESEGTLSAEDMLAKALEDQGKYEAAEQMSRRTLEGTEKALGPEHPSTLMSVGNLAGVLIHQGKYEAAEQMSRRALEGIEKAMGPEHPSTLMSVNNLAWALTHQGKYEAAEQMNRRALEGTEKALGEEHPSTLTSVCCLAFLLRKMDDHNTAMELYHRAYAGYVKTLGSSHPTTIQCFNHMSSLQRSMRGKREEAGVRAKTLPDASVGVGKVNRLTDSTILKTRDRNGEQQPHVR